MDRLASARSLDAAPSHCAHSRFHHKECFVCVHCKEKIGSRRFVVLDGEPYLEGCYHIIFGGNAPSQVQESIGSVRRRYAIAVPLSLPSLGGEKGLPAFMETHQRLVQPARRELREKGVLDLHYFLSTAVSGMPMLIFSLSLRDDADAKVRLLPLREGAQGNGVGAVSTPSADPPRCARCRRLLPTLSCNRRSCKRR
eukprot:scaffold111955_cov36-Tisochrysis_lutea.AAC.4